MIIGLVGNGKMAKSIKGICKYPIVNIDPFSDVNCDVLLDFSNPKTLDMLLDYGIRNKKPVVIGTTGYSSAQLDEINRASRQIPIFISSNYSKGIYILKKLVRFIIPFIKEDYDIELIETHHRDKLDIPSGTALDILNDINESKKYDVVIGRNKPREKREIGVHSLRGGSVFGEHKIIILGDGEKITLEHIADNREIFSKGAIEACEFIKNKKKGLYNMEDLVKNGL